MSRLLIFPRLFATLVPVLVVVLAPVACESPAPPAVPVLARLTNHSSADRYPKWSPDGTMIAFTSTRGGNSEIHVIEFN